MPLDLVLVQTRSSRDKEANLEAALRTIAELEVDGPTLVAFPEMYMALPGDGPLAAQAETLDGPFVRALAAAAAERGVHILCGVWEVSPDPERVYNTLAVVTPDGRLVDGYRKVHLFDALTVRESDRMVPGEAPPPVIEIGDVRVGVAICYDLRFPELFRDLAARAADVVVVPSAWYAGPLKEDHWLTLLRARAIETTCFVAGAGLTGAPFSGRSAAFDPFGVPIADAGENAGQLRVRVDPVRVRDVREKLPTLRHRRPGVFGGGGAA